MSQAPTPLAENEGIQRLMQAEDEAAQIIKTARDNRSIRLRQAESEAENAAQEYRIKLENELSGDVDLKDDTFDEFAKNLDKQSEVDSKEIRDAYQKNKAAVISLLLYQVTHVKLEVSEAMKQAVLSKQKEEDSLKL